MDQLAETLRAVVGRDAVLTEPGELLVYECDGLPQHKYPPRAVVFPESTDETAELMRVLARFNVPFTPRGAGTGLSGGALPLNRGVVIELARMRGILKIDEENRIAVVQTGVVNAHVSLAVAHFGLHYVPDPSSQPTCTIGGNIAENAGGIHCLKYGTTTDHILKARVVLAGGAIVDLSGGETGAPGYDLLGVFIGSEGTFGIATEATLRLVPLPPTVRTLLADFADVNDASHAVSAIIAAGVMPAALEMMDREIIRAVEASVFAAGLPLDAEAALLIELDGIEAGIDDEAEGVKAICLQRGARNCRLARDENERKKLWAARKGAFGAIGRIAPDSMIQDAVVPRSRLPEVLSESYRIAAKYGLVLANVFHAGDGNLHPLICFDSRSPEQVQRVKEAGRELMETCVRAGGSITGEHGVGLDKREFLPLIFSDDDMDTMLRVRAAFDPLGLCNPGKIIPLLRGCGEARAVVAARMSVPGADRGPQGGSPAGAVDATGSREALASRQQQRAPASPNQSAEDTPERQSLSALRDGKVAARGNGDAQTRGDSSAIAAVNTSRPGVRTFEADAAALRTAQIVGDSNISASPHLRVSASFSVAPGSIAEVCEVMKLASSEGWGVVPSGAATWLDAGNPLDRVNIIVSTARLNQVLEHEPADLVASTQAGVTLNAFNERLAAGGQWLPLDPPDDGSATIGGVVATGLAGAQQCGYGPPRRYVIGMRVVLADGKLVKAGGRVVKNVAGYDLCKLFAGSFGTLGLITEVTFKLRPIPAETRTLLASGSVEALISGARAVMGSGIFPVAVEILSPRLALAADLTNEPIDHLMLLRLAGSRLSVIDQAARAEEFLKHRTALPPTTIAKNDALVWRQLAELPLRFANHLVSRASVQAGDLLRFLRTPGLFPAQTMWQASMAASRLRIIDTSTANIPQNIRWLELLRSEAQALGGSLFIEHAPLEIKRGIHCWGDLGPALPVMNRVKQQLDPNRILSPGRFGFEN